MNNEPKSIEEVFEMWQKKTHYTVAPPIKPLFVEFVRYYLETEKGAINS